MSSAPTPAPFPSRKPPPPPAPPPKHLYECTGGNMTCHAKIDRPDRPGAFTIQPPTPRIRGIEAHRPKPGDFLLLPPDFEPSFAVKMALSALAGSASAMGGMYVGMSTTGAASFWWPLLTVAAAVAVAVVVGHRTYQRGLDDGWHRRGEHDLRQVDGLRGRRIDTHA